MTRRPLAMRTATGLSRRRSAVVLLEVVVAMSIFFVAAAVITGGMISSLRSAKAIRAESRAADLAVTLMSQIQMGLVPVADDGPNEYEQEDLEGWTWQVVTSSVQLDQDVDDGTLRVEIIVASPDGRYVCRMGQLLADPNAEPTPGQGAEDDVAPELWGQQ